MLDAVNWRPERSSRDLNMPAQASAKSLWFLPRVSVRALMILALVVSVGLGWTVNTVRTARIQRASVAAVEAAGGYVFYDCDRDPKRIITVRSPEYHKYMPRGQNMPDLKPPPRAGIDYFHSVIEVVLRGILSDDELVRIGRFPRVEKVWHAGSTRWVSDAGLAHLDGLASLKELDLSDSRITDLGLVHLKGMKSLERLSLARTGITDLGLVHLRSLTSLRAISLRGTDVSNAGVVHLKALTNLRSLDLSGTDVDEIAARELRRSLPNVSILVKAIWEAAAMQNSEFLSELSVDGFLKSPSAPEPMRIAAAWARSRFRVTRWDEFVATAELSNSENTWTVYIEPKSGERDDIVSVTGQGDRVTRFGFHRKNKLKGYAGRMGPKGMNGVEPGFCR
jgi:hypothetical protein